MILSNKENKDPSSSLSEPPPYDLSTGTSRASTSAAYSEAELIPDIQPSNFLVIKRDHENIRGSYVIDPTLAVPEEFSSLSQWPSKDSYSIEENVLNAARQRRHNLFIKNSHGSIKAKIWIIPGQTTLPGESREPASIVMIGAHNSIVVRFHANCEVQPFNFIASAKHGWINVSIPPSFVGPIKFKSVRGDIALSPAAKARLRVFSDVNGIRTCFVGDFIKYQHDKAGWNGGSIDLSSVHGRIKLSFMDEPEDLRGWGGFLFSLFKVGNI